MTGGYTRLLQHFCAQELFERCRSKQHYFLRAGASSVFCLNQRGDIIVRMKDGSNHEIMFALSSEKTETGTHILCRLERSCGPKRALNELIVAIGHELAIQPNG